MQRRQKAADHPGQRRYDGLQAAAFCNRQYSATQYALLSSLMAIARSFAASTSGFWVEMMGWYEFFVLTGFLMVPALLLLVRMINDERKVS